MERRQTETINAMMKEMQEQQAKREAELQLILEEKNRQIEIMKQSEQERNQITSQIQSMFLEERDSANKEMQSFLQTFQKQRDQTAERLEKLSIQERAKLQEEMTEAKQIYHEKEEMRRTFMKAGEGGAAQQ